MPKKRKATSRRRIFWAWTNHIHEGSALYLSATRRKDDVGRVRVRITVL